MSQFMLQSFASLGTGLLVGVVFALFRLPVPAPPVVPAVFGILGITLGYLLFHRLFG
jgi:XapX domain-containing protein